MTKRMLLAVLLLIVFALPAGCQKQGGEPTQPTAPAPTILPTPTPEPSPTPTPDPVGEALAGMTVEQKAAQLLVAGIEGTEPGEDAVQAVQGYQVGGVILFGRNVESAEQLAALTNGLKELNGDYTPLFLCVDQEGGRVDRMPPEVSRSPPPWTLVPLPTPRLGWMPALRWARPWRPSALPSASTWTSPPAWTSGPTRRTR
ncbi:MAG: glycoside hydrolase family 3 N-terminal domain-containing protein [Flavonifractor plautii]